MAYGETPSQTVGPYFAYGLTAGQYAYDFTDIADPTVAGPDAAGEHIRITGTVFDGEGNPVNDAMIEIWQADANGNYNEKPVDVSATDFRGLGRCGTGTDAQNRFWFDTVKPGVVADAGAPFVNVIIFMRGMLVHAFTRFYFDDEADRNAKDPVLQSVPENRRDTLIAKRVETPTGIEYRIDIHMQGDAETVFFDV
ncbi:protocatechuate 3,4-dioxygenase subunit alpha [Thalassospira indica]|uniref:Protocatechuate 3,4-dioxygenase subunit alpha n=1 Tax=Thalassospira indica TaxID=1891279 RepID=A0ABM6XZP8_9PROT|nr:protocatechuate 3,4-dioxygenase subunit alpha [Thalassospira indica]AXO15208.1 protocatechuate 3,4-dioxygenase subunit alpha [Thalassospira indica]OAZ08667.1 protocatechuate 3,4-dioxygenase [Thalassospira profundimaris]